jgi:hypothetical protein
MYTDMSTRCDHMYNNVMNYKIIFLHFFLVYFIKIKNNGKKCKLVHIVLYTMLNF